MHFTEGDIQSAMDIIICSAQRDCLRIGRELSLVFEDQPDQPDDPYACYFRLTSQGTESLVELFPWEVDQDGVLIVKCRLKDPESGELKEREFKISTLAGLLDTGYELAEIVKTRKIEGLAELKNQIRKTFEGILAARKA